MAKTVLYLLMLFFFANDASCRSHHHGKSSRNGEDDGKIVGGYNTTIQSVPYQVFVLLQKGNDYYQCGGSIISNRYILTAAHCLSGVSKAYVRAGSTNSNSGGTQYTSSLIRSHPQYNSKTYDYDVGLIQLSSPIRVDNKNTKVIKLPAANTKVKPGTQVLVSGWGTTKENGQSPTNLMAVRVPVVSNADCNKSYSNGITTRMFCAGLQKGGKDSCQGDSGGPAVANNMQLGVVSFGMGCARPKYPGVYTNVPAIRNWIKQNTGV